MIKWAVIDHVGQKAGMDAYSSALVRGFVNKSSSACLISNVVESEHIECHSFFPKEKLAKWRAPFDWVRSWKKSISLCKTEGIEQVVVHLFSFQLKDEWAINSLKKSGLKIHAIVHDLDHLGGAKQLATRTSRILQLCHAIYVHNSFSQAAIKKYGIEEVRLIPHTNFHDVPEFVLKEKARKELQLPLDQPLALFFGQIKKVKGLDLLLNAMPLVNGQLIIAGRPYGMSMNKIDQQILSLGIESKLHLYVRYITNQERNLLFQAADYIVLPYRKIFQSGVLQMAFSYRLPVICSDLEVFEEIIQNNTFGQTVTIGNVQELAKAMNNMSSKLELAQQKAEKAYQMAAQNFNIEKVVEQFTAI